MKIAMMFYHLLAFILLAWFAGLQLNDPDPLYWGGFYGLCALVPLLAALRVEGRVLYALYSICVVYGITALALSLHGGVEYLHHAGSESLLHGMSPDRPYIEETRELLGALIALGLISVYPLANWKRRRTADAG